MNNRKWIALSALVLTLLATWNLPPAASSSIKSAVRDGLSPLQAVATTGAVRFREAVRYLRGIGNLVEENRALHDTLAEAQARLSVLEEAETSNRVYRRLLGFSRNQPHALVAAEVIGRDSAGWWHTLRINKGAARGIRPDRAVIAYPGGLVGRTVSVGDTTCDVLLASDPSCLVSVRVVPAADENARLFGVMKGVRGPAGFPEPFAIDFLDQTAEVSPGDPVTTSGLGGIYPKGIPVGTVTRVETDEAGLYQRAWVSPAVPLDRLEYVFVVQTADDQSPPDPDSDFAPDADPPPDSPLPDIP